MSLGLGLCRLGKSSFSNGCSDCMLCLLVVSLCIPVGFFYAWFYIVLYFIVFLVCKAFQSCLGVLEMWLINIFSLQLSSMINPIMMSFILLPIVIFSEEFPRYRSYSRMQQLCLNILNVLLLRFLEIAGRAFLHDGSLNILH